MSISRFFCYNQVMKFNRYQLSPPILDTDSSVEQEEIKFDLFVQSRQVKEVIALLQQTMLQTKTGRQNWLRQNQEIVDELLNDLLDSSLLMIDGMKLDHESLNLSVELVTNIKEALTLMQHLVDQKPVLN